MKNVKLDDKNHKKLKVKCAELDLEINYVVNKLVEAWVDGKIGQGLVYKKEKE